MATLPNPHTAGEFTPTTKRPPASALDHIPGADGLPVIGATLAILSDPPRFSRNMLDRYGRIYKVNSFGYYTVSLIGPEANELVLFDREKLFSSEHGWGPVLDQLFPRGLMLLDFDHHKMDRRALSIAFKPGPMRHYADSLNRGIAQRVEEWGAGAMEFYPAIKQLTLDLAADSFIDLPLGEEAAKINQAFVDMVQASVAPIRKPLPFTQMGRGVKGRRYLVDWFGRETVRRRESGGGQDMFSQFARATREDGELLSVQEVVDHMIFLMMAAHDTITSSATTMVYQLALNPEWQEKIRQEVRAATGGDDGFVSYEQLGELDITEMAFKEALRFMPPVPSIPRRALRAFEFGGYTIPAGTQVSVSPGATHWLEDIWPDPDRFDPMRFTREAEKARHKYAWVPFGGGAHMCLGLHFAYMQIKILMAHLLTRYRIEMAEGYEPEWQAWPIPKPKDGLRISLRPL
ncbi:cytochrome P450 [Qipengyuania sp.]|uniref:cytochrome P450 n=1 Tax=Qipengyuania sp. TaxID=2004515 RepID=UPI0035C7E2DB